LLIHPSARAWYTPGDTVQYIRGSQQLGLEKNTYATVVATDPQTICRPFARADGQHVARIIQFLIGNNHLHSVAAWADDKQSLDLFQIRPAINSFIFLQWTLHCICELSEFEALVKSIYDFWLTTARLRLAESS
jgi:hypothetical protein